MGTGISEIELLWEILKQEGIKIQIKTGMHNE
jgi:hypothetical protein